jgi:hypothetical protein
MKQRVSTALSGAVVAAAILLAVVLPVTPAFACSCALVTTDQMADSAGFAFVGSEVGRVDTRSGDWQSVLVTFAVDEWLSHADGPPEFQAFTGQGDADCGVGPVRGQVAVFAHGTHGEASIDSCGSIHPVGDAVAAFEGRVVPPYPVAFDDSPDDSGGGSGSYVDLALLVAGGAAVLAAVVLGAVAIRRRQDSGIE